MSILEEDQRLQRGVLVSLASLHQIRQALQVISFLTEATPHLVPLETGQRIRKEVQKIDSALTITVYENQS